MDQDQLENLRRRINDTPANSDGRRRYTAPLKRDLVAFARERQKAGWTQRQIAEALDISKATVCCWVGNKRTGAKKKRKAVKAWPLKVVKVQALNATPESSPTLLLASGHRDEGLSFDQLVQLVKEL